MGKRLFFTAFFMLSLCVSGLYGQGGPVDTHATRKTKALLANLKLVADKGIVFGHQDDLAYGVGWKAVPGKSDVKDGGGDYPGVYGWDVSKLGRPFNIDTVNFDQMRSWIKEGFRRGGVITISWHMDNPLTGGDAWDKTPAVASILPGGVKHDFYKQRLDLFAGYIKSLKVGLATRIPVIFRPFHEHTGNWFWWGKGNCSKEEFITLWRFTVNYLRDEKHLHQLLYCFSTDQFDSEAQFLNFYPGDEFVDILAFDDYHSIKNAAGRDKFVYRLNTVANLATKKNKVAALSETGVEGIPDANWFTDVLLAGFESANSGRGIAYALVWRNANTHHHYAPYRRSPSSDNFKSFVADPLILLERDLPKMYKKP